MELVHEQILKKIQEFSTLQYDWDGYDAAPISEEVIELSQEFANELNAKYPLDLWEVFPTPRGTIQFEKDNPYVEVEIFPNGTYVVYREADQLEFSSFDLEAVLDKLN